MTSAGPWIWGWRVDLAVFGGSALLALAVASLSASLSDGGAMPAWAWLGFVLALDVAHVWSTLFRTYLDGEELRRRRLLYVALPLGCYALGVALHSLDGHTFWRVLAYVAVFHFVRQQVGWVAIYRARAGERERIDRWLDDAVIYAATGWPLLYWHAHLPREFSWFLAGDFVDLSRLAPLVAPLGGAYVLLLLAYVVRGLQRWQQGHAVNLGKHVVVVATASIWYVGIVVVNEDFTFTVTNVTIHAVPYFALLWAYARARAEERPRSLLGNIVGYGIGGFLAVALAFAFCEEMLWDRLVWHERPYFFGGDARDAPLLSPTLLSLLVPLLALPQLLHYALDGVLWRRKDTGQAQARALGFR